MKGNIARIMRAIVPLSTSLLILGILILGLTGCNLTIPTLTTINPRITKTAVSQINTETVVSSTALIKTSTPTATPIPATPSATIPPPTPQITATQGLVTTETLVTLENTFIPVNDPLELSLRLLGVNNLTSTAAPPAPHYQLGAKESFWIGSFRRPFILRYITDHAYFWIADNITYSQGDLVKLASTFEDEIYPTDREFFGTEWSPGEDGDSHIYILYTKNLGTDVGGYFGTDDEYPPSLNKYSNGHEMFYINADYAELDEPNAIGILAHEFQHMITWNQDRNESLWLNEGFSELAISLNGLFSESNYAYLSHPDLQLNDWSADDEQAALHYSASYLFVTYFLDRFGESATKALAANPDNDLTSVETTLRAMQVVDPETGQPVTAESFFMDWAATNYLMDPAVIDGRYTYKYLPEATPAQPTESFDTCPVSTKARSVHQFGVDYIRFTCPGHYVLHFEGITQLPMLSQSPHSGNYAMWSNNNPLSDTSLTQSFDLTGYSGPLTLNYWTWYQLWENWGYVYLEASTDGENWQIIHTPSGTSDDPNGGSFGWAYTGFSGKDVAVWKQETIDLSQFAGQKLTLRFEFVSAAGESGEGFLLDDISIPQIGYATDFEADDGGWQAAGWARIQNVLPQKYGLALISVGDITTVQNLTLNPDNIADIPIDIGDGVDSVVLVVAGTTRFTRQTAPYHFTVTAP